MPEQTNMTPLELRALSEAVAELGAAVTGASMGLQVKMDKASDRLASNLDTSMAKLVASLDAAARAANEATEASTKYAGRLVWATWALVAVTLILATGPALERVLPVQTAGQRECSDVAAYIAAQSSQPSKRSNEKDAPWYSAPIAGAPNATWSRHAEAVAAYFRCLGRR